MYETYLEQGEKIVQLEQQTLEMKTLSQDHNELEVIVEKYHKTVDRLTNELRQKEKLCINQQEQNREFELIIRDTNRGKSQKSVNSRQ